MRYISNAYDRTYQWKLDSAAMTASWESASALVDGAIMVSHLAYTPAIPKVYTNRLGYKIKVLDAPRIQTWLGGLSKTKKPCENHGN